MSSYARHLRRQAAIKAAKVVSKERKSSIKSQHPSRQYRSFNIFTKDGENRVVTSKRPMTLEAAQYYFGALSISGIN